MFRTPASTAFTDTQPGVLDTRASRAIADSNDKLRIESPLDYLLHLACPVLFVLAVALNPLDQSDATPAGSAQAGMNLEVALKLLVAAATGLTAAIGLVMCPSTRERLIRFPGWLLVGLASVFVATSLFAYGPSANVSRAAALISAIYIGFIAVSLQVMGMRRAMNCVLIGLTLHLIVAWVLYMIGGENAIYKEELAGATVIDRMGSTAHPNSLGRMGALAIIVVLAVIRSRREQLSPTLLIVLVGIAMLAAATMFESMSRTAFAAGGIGVIALMSDRIMKPRGIALSLLALVFVCALLIGAGLISSTDAIGERVVSVGTKTGDVAELTSATGRTEIWAEGIRLFLQKPLTGWGLNSAPLLMEDFSYHTHNLLIHALFSSGIFAGLLVSVLLVWTVSQAIQHDNPLLRGVAGYICVSGIFEDTAFETFPFSSTILWLMVLLAVQVPRPRKSNAVSSSQVDEEWEHDEGASKWEPRSPSHDIAEREESPAWT